ncbi:LysR family transcriptional regulator [Burkholderia sp. BCC1988]|uniref:LysR family transcriptional regulator n=1 Tax=Burkholderia sp. BCC1988 TaxID=2817443 RepID=UPI002AAF7179|nr:LysR family transcriptional regulator [Burkholderia sp. BCC1988]
MRIDPLPPMQSLVYFEAAARHGSFKGAAKELSVTQGAISKQIGKLESYLQTPLFIRMPNALDLTDEGRKYVRDIRGLLGHTSQVTAALMNSPKAMAITILCDEEMAHLWLGPNLPKFCRENPDIAVRIVVRKGMDVFTASEFDLGLFYLGDREKIPQGLTQEKIITGRFGVYCSPSYLGGKLLQPGELVNKTLLVDDDVLHLTHWQTWFQVNNVNDPVHSRMIRANSYPLLVNMAIAGHGVIVGFDYLYSRLVGTGELVLASEATADFGGSYYIVHPLDCRRSPSAMKLFNWLVGIFRQKLPTV